MSYRTTTGGDSRAAVGCAVVAVVALMVMLLAVAVAPYYFTQFWWMFRSAWFWILPLVAVVLGAVFGGATWESDRTISVGAWLITGGLAIGSICFWVSHSYLEDSYYASSVRISTAPAPQFSYRAPYNISEQQARPDLGETTGNTVTPMYLPDLGNFTTLVEQIGQFTGYRTLLTQTISDTGRNDHALCDFGPAADRRFGGLFGHSLGRLINEQQRWVNWDTDDAYGYCAGPDHPMVVVPLTEQDGWLVVTNKPAGLAVYDGATGHLDIVTDAKQIAAIPGPTYPLSLASRQRESLGAINGFSDWFWGRAGWKSPDDADAINSSNANEFVLGTDRHAPQYVNLLTSQGGATAISVITTVDARLAGLDLSQLVVHHTNPVWLSTGAIENQIHVDFGDVFALNQRAGISELAPLDGNTWVATIGLPQSMMYRVRGVGDTSKPACLYGLDDQLIRCGPATNANGAGPGLAIGQAPAANQPVPVAPAPASSDLKTLTKPQLVDLIGRATAELANRP